jgi:hypothetical protein
MKKSIILIVGLILLTLSSLAAHPPRKINAEFDQDKNLLTISFNHDVKNAGEHYVSEIVVLQNKKEIIRQKLDYQDSLTGGTVVYKINHYNSKDKFTISATCNKYGKNSVVLGLN